MVPPEGGRQRRKPAHGDSSEAPITWSAPFARHAESNKHGSKSAEGVELGEEGTSDMTAVWV